MKYVILFRCRKFYLGAEAEKEAEKEAKIENEDVVYQKYRHRVCRDIIQKNKYKYCGKVFESSLLKSTPKKAFNINVFYNDDTDSRKGRYLEYLKKMHNY